MEYIIHLNVTMVVEDNRLESAKLKALKKIGNKEYFAEVEDARVTAAFE